MQPLSTHYYVLSLTKDEAVLYEAFRDVLIRVENRGFPVVATAGGVDGSRAHMRTVDACLESHYHEQPLGLVVVGDAEHQHAFELETGHMAAIIGTILRDRSDTPSSDLGQIVWPVVKDQISGLFEDARRELEECIQQGRGVPGLENVASAVRAGVCGMLLVESDYLVKGGLNKGTDGPAISREVDIRDPIDDAVDAVIQRLLEMGGRVVFLPPKSLQEHDRVVLLPNKESEG